MAARIAPEWVGFHEDVVALQDQLIKNWNGTHAVEMGEGGAGSVGENNAGDNGDGDADKSEGESKKAKNKKGKRDTKKKDEGRVEL